MKKQQHTQAAMNLLIAFLEDDDPRAIKVFESGFDADDYPAKRIPTNTGDPIPVELPVQSLDIDFARALCYFFGIGTVKDIEKSLELLRGLCEFETIPGANNPYLYQYNLTLVRVFTFTAKCYFRGIFSHETQLNYTLDLLNRAIKFKYPPAICMLADLYYYCSKQPELLPRLPIELRDTVFLKAESNRLYHLAISHDDHNSRHHHAYAAIAREAILQKYEKDSVPLLSDEKIIELLTHSDKYGYLPGTHFLANELGGEQGIALCTKAINAYPLVHKIDSSSRVILQKLGKLRKTLIAEIEEYRAILKEESQSTGPSTSPRFSK